MIFGNFGQFAVAGLLLLMLSTDDGFSSDLQGSNITIKRDTFGTPHIYAKNDYDLFYGYGYVLAEDRLYQLEILKRSTQGEVAEVLGKDFIAFDRKQRTLFWPADIQADIALLDGNMKQLFEGFAAGINDRISRVLADPERLMPYEFNVNGFRPEFWTDYDVVMMFVGSMLLRFGDFNTELENQSFLTDLIETHGEEDAWKIFNAVIPTKNSFAPTTIPAGDWQKLSGNGFSSRQGEYSGGGDSDDFLQTRGHGFSNALVLGPERLIGAKSVLINGPQFGWYAPAYTYSVGFHSPNWDAVGNAPLGYPLPMFGYNKYITWGSTWAVMDNVDIFRETLNPENPRQYKYNGQWKTLRARKEIIKVKDGEDMEFTALNSIHGPVIHMNKQYAFAKKRGWAGRELDTLTGWIEATRARNHAEWIKAVSKSALNVNWYFADKKGNIGYGSMGAYPVRAKGHDNRLPVSGEGDMDWVAIQSPAKNPQKLNPSSHYIANWNNKPGAGVDNPDEWWASWSEADRVKTIDDAVKKAGRMTPDAAWNLMMRAAFTDPNATYFKPLMLAALEKHQSGNPLYASVREVLFNWDGSFSETTGDGTFNSAGNSYKHPGNAIFRAWLGEMMTSVLSDDLPGKIGGIIARVTGYPTADKPTIGSHNISVGLKLLFEVLQGRSDYDFLNGRSADDIWIMALDRTINNLTAQYGRDISRWHLPVPATRFNHVNFMGIPQSLPATMREDMPDMNRGTENNMTVFKKSGPTGYEVVPPGQSGFIKPDGEKAKHFDDQYLMYQKLQKKQTWLYKQDVDSHSERTYILPIKHH
ncbi:MAG: penicillin amidase [Alphaproteobacteria bacterium]|nr:MAG: penicillin amidase [Alphaproteobacteria bacterium]